MQVLVICRETPDLITQFAEITAGGILSQSLANATTTNWTISSVFDPYFGVYVEAQDRCVLLLSAPNRLKVMMLID